MKTLTLVGLSIAIGAAIAGAVLLTGCRSTPDPSTQLPAHPITQPVEMHDGTPVPPPAW